MTAHISQQVGSQPGRQWFGVYEARVVNSRAGDLYVRAKVPQVLGDAVTDWAPPMLDPRRQTQYDAYGVPYAPAFPPGPGPGAGSRVLVMFIGGDINSPVYCLLGI